MAKKHGTSGINAKGAELELLKHAELEGILLKLNNQERLTLLLAAGITPLPNASLWIDQIIHKLIS